MAGIWYKTVPIKTYDPTNIGMGHKTMDIDISIHHKMPIVDFEVENQDGESDHLSINADALRTLIEFLLECEKTIIERNSNE